MGMTQEEILELVTHGGGTLVFIALASVLALGLAIERFVTMRKILPEARLLHGEISKELLRGDVSQAQIVATHSRAFVAEIFLKGMARWSRTGGREFLEAVDRERLSRVLILKKRLWAIGTIGTIAPFIGLFGTVVGIMSAFSSMAESGTGGFAVVASGISQALVATASGIAVAIEAVIFYNYFQAKLGGISGELKLIADEFCELLSDVSCASTSATVEPSVSKGSPPDDHSDSASSNADGATAELLKGKA